MLGQVKGGTGVDQAYHFLAIGDQEGIGAAIIVGAGSSDTFHRKLPFSSYGSRVDVQAWGKAVVSACSEEESNRQEKKGFYQQQVQRPNSQQIEIYQPRLFQ